MPIVAPSILSCDFLHLKKECDHIIASGADWLHLDVMDGLFVPNISFGMPIVSAINRTTEIWLDVHLMITKPAKYINDFHRAGADSIALHIEASSNPQEDLNLLNRLGLKPAIAINPDTTLETIFPLLPFCHHVCFMSVFPGFSGQKFIPSSIERIQQLKKEIIRQALPTRIQVDGGVTLENATAIVNAGADILVAGNTIFSSDNPDYVIQQLKHTK